MSSHDRSVYWLGSALGGLSFAVVSTGIMWVAEKKEPTLKTIGRDLLLGVILFFLLLQLIPESTTTLITGIISIFAYNVPAAVITNPIVETIVDEMEVRVGVPKF